MTSENHTDIEKIKLSCQRRSVCLLSIIQSLFSIVLLGICNHGECQSDSERRYADTLSKVLYKIESDAKSFRPDRETAELMRLGSSSDVTPVVQLKGSREIFLRCTRVQNELCQGLSYEIFHKVHEQLFSRRTPIQLSELLELSATANDFGRHKEVVKLYKEMVLGMRTPLAVSANSNGKYLAVVLSSLLAVGEEKDASVILKRVMTEKEFSSADKGTVAIVQGLAQLQRGRPREAVGALSEGVRHVASGDHAAMAYYWLAVDATANQKEGEAERLASRAVGQIPQGSRGNPVYRIELTRRLGGLKNSKVTSSAASTSIRSTQQRAIPLEQRGERDVAMYKILLRANSSEVK
jgi:hypothetical protein